MNNNNFVFGKCVNSTQIFLTFPFENFNIASVFPYEKKKKKNHVILEIIKIEFL